MSDRLEELRRQRALQREHLEWLDREIAALEADLWSEPASPQPAGEGPPLIAESPPEATEDPLAHYRAPAGAIERSTKLGCLLYFAVAVGLLGLGVAALYVHIRAGRAR